MKEAILYKKLENNQVRCQVCGHKCLVAEGKRGFCNVRENREGKLYSLVYGKAVSVAVDPIQKKPLYNFAPGTRALSIATVGCNMRCSFCQNWSISQEFGKIKGEEHSPEDLVRMAKGLRCSGIAYTYTEPTVFLEYCYDTMKKTETELYNVWISNGYMTEKTVDLIAPHLDAVNIDIKGSVEFYKEMCGVNEMDTIYKALKKLKEHNVWIEITNLIIPGYNDDDYHIESLVKWIKENLGKETPLHFSKFHPHYKLTDVKPTPLSTLDKAVKIAKENGLEYIYVGNVPGHERDNTYCPECGKLLIKREGFSIKEFKIEKDGRCFNCGMEVDIKGERWIPEELFEK